MKAKKNAQCETEAVIEHPMQGIAIVAKKSPSMRGRVAQALLEAHVKTFGLPTHFDATVSVALRACDLAEEMVKQLGERGWFMDIPLPEEPSLADESVHMHGRPRL